MFAWASALLHLRAELEAFAIGEQQDVMADTTAIAFLRGDHLGEGCKAGGRERILVVVSRDAAVRNVELPITRTGLENCTVFKPLFPAAAAEAKVQDGKVSIPVSANGAAIYAIQ